MNRSMMRSPLSYSLAIATVAWGVVVGSASAGEWFLGIDVTKPMKKTPANKYAQGAGQHHRGLQHGSRRDDRISEQGDRGSHV